MNCLFAKPKCDLGGPCLSVIVIHLQLSDGQKVELGATWLHGSKGHPVYELALAYGLMTPSDLSDSELQPA